MEASNIMCQNVVGGHGISHLLVMKKSEKSHGISFLQMSGNPEMAHYVLHENIMKLMLLLKSLMYLLQIQWLCCEIKRGRAVTYTVSQKVATFLFFE